MVRVSLGGWLASVLVMGGALASLGCSSTTEGAHRAQEAFARVSDSLTPDEEDDGAYSFMVATRLRNGGYRVAALNYAPLLCPDGFWADSCRVASIDLTPTLVSADDAAAILTQIGDDASRATLLFVGKVEGAQTLRGGNRREGRLLAWEVWRAPEARPLRGTWYHVSHGAKQSLLVNAWDVAPVTSLDLDASPTMSYCRKPTAECLPSHDGVMEDAVAPAGLVVNGWRSRAGVVHVSQYFLKIDFGQARLPNGYWFCRADQVACDDGDCVPTEDICHVQSGHGRGLLTYSRAAAQEVQPWFVSTTQLTAAETAPAP